ncbi:MAG: proton-conducting transporter membrane subunit [Pirellulales bacterium]
MNELHLPWLELAIAVPLVGAIVTAQIRDPDAARRYSLVFCGIALLLTLGAWCDYATLSGGEVHDPWDLMMAFHVAPVIGIDALSAPLLSLASLLSLLTVLATLRTKVRRLSFPRLLLSEAILLATFSTDRPWVIIALLVAGTISPYINLRLRRRSTRVFVLHMMLFVALLVTGQWLVDVDRGVGSVIGIGLLMAAVLVRSGIVPLHCWMTDLFENATFGTALLFVTPMVGVYAALRLVLPIAPEWALHSIAMLSLLTAVYAAGMALVQREARRFFCYLFLSHSSLVFVGLETATAISLTAALCMWISVSISMAGFGLTLRSVESRTGRLSLDEFHGLYHHTPGLALLFLVTGLASIGFPGTAGFIGAELLVDGMVHTVPLVGVIVVCVAALNGLAVMHAYFRVFTGTPHVAKVDLKIRRPERIAVLVLTALIFGGGLYPQPGVVSRYAVAEQLVKDRQRRLGPATTHHGHAAAKASVEIQMQ